jgi:hypothetical protein
MEDTSLKRIGATASFLFIQNFSVVHSFLKNFIHLEPFSTCILHSITKSLRMIPFFQYFTNQIKILPSCTDFFVNYEIIRLFLV